MEYKYISKHNKIDYKTLLMTSLQMAQISSDHPRQAITKLLKVYVIVQ